ncbi:MAG: HAD family hydrolase [Bacilli bacterium]|nr:HAD family hydrolase [Bacilli bacterium]
MKDYKLYIFDLDGTTVDSTECFKECYRSAFEACNVKFDETYNINYVVLNVEEVYNQIKDLSDVADSQQKFYTAFVKNISPTFTKYGKFYDDVKDVFETLKNKHALVTIFTNRVSKEIKGILKVNPKIKAYANSYVGADMVKNPKPAPDGIIKILDKYEIEKEDAIFIGDGKGDYESANAAGIDFFYIDRYNINEIPLEPHKTLKDLIK